MERCEDSGLKDVGFKGAGLKDVRLGQSCLRMSGNSSKGTQLKYFQDGIWYKQDQNGYEGRSEAFCSLLLSCTNVESYVTYEECRINGRRGCLSRNFLKDGEEAVTLQRLYEYSVGGQLNDAVRRQEKVADRVQYVLDFVKKAANLDMREYFAQMMALDMVTLNIDRHFHNICLIRRQGGGYRVAPIFDNGAALLSNYGRFPVDDSLTENIGRAVAAPFSGSFEQQAAVLGMGLSISTDIWERLKTAPDCRAKQVLEYQLGRYVFLIQ